MKQGSRGTRCVPPWRGWPRGVEHLHSYTQRQPECPYKHQHQATRDAFIAETLLMLPKCPARPQAALLQRAGGSATGCQYSRRKLSAVFLALLGGGEKGWEQVAHAAGGRGAWHIFKEELRAALLLVAAAVAVVALWLAAMSSGSEAVQKRRRHLEDLILLLKPFA